MSNKLVDVLISGYNKFRANHDPLGKIINPNEMDELELAALEAAAQNVVDYIKAKQTIDFLDLPTNATSMDVARAYRKSVSKGEL